MASRNPRTCTAAPNPQERISTLALTSNHVRNPWNLFMSCCAFITGKHSIGLLHKFLGTYVRTSQNGIQMMHAPHPAKHMVTNKERRRRIRQKLFSQQPHPFIPSAMTDDGNSIPARPAIDRKHTKYKKIDDDSASSLLSVASGTSSQHVSTRTGHVVLRIRFQ